MKRKVALFTSEDTNALVVEVKGYVVVIDKYLRTTIPKKKYTRTDKPFEVLCANLKNSSGDEVTLTTKQKDALYYYARDVLQSPTINDILKYGDGKWIAPNFLER